VFSVDLACPSREVIERLCNKLEAGPQQLKRARSPGGGANSIHSRDEDHFLLSVPEAEQRVWTPWLTIDVTQRGDGAHVFGRFGPHPSVWTGYAFGYLSLGLLLMFSLVFAGAQAMTAGAPWALWVSAGVAAAMGALFGASQVAQRMARPQMEVLRQELERAIEVCKAAIPADRAAAK
jgi:hypothetical protein